MHRHPAYRRATLGRTAAPPGYTLVELGIVVVVMAILAVIAIPLLGNALDDRFAWAAAQRVETDIQWARQQAIATSAPKTVTFSGNAYELIGLEDPTRAGQPYVVDLAGAGYQAEVVGVDLGGDQSLVFDAYGAADSDGEVLIRVGGFQRRVKIQRSTGVVTIEEL